MIRIHSSIGDKERIEKQKYQMKQYLMIFTDFMMISMPIFCFAGMTASNILGQEKPSILWGQDFENQLPGEVVDGWRKTWGDMGEDSFSISNIQVLSGKRSALLDRKNVIKSGGYGVAIILPPIKDDWIVLSVPFLVEGAGNDASFSIELRAPHDPVETPDAANPHRKLLIFSIIDRKIFSQAGEAKNHPVFGSLLGSYDENHWYRLIAILPLHPNTERQARVLLEKNGDAGSWQQVRPPQSIPITIGLEKGFQVMINFASNKRGFLLYLDDLRLEKWASPGIVQKDETGAQK
ncbi:MAG: hypothetical protein WC657_07710 [Candidatus Paceibacterota bacterium]